MSTTMWDAREALIPGGAYDRASAFNGSIAPRHQYYRTHDQLGMINPTPGLQAQPAIANLPVPVNMYMSQSIPPNYFQNGQAQGRPVQKAGGRAPRLSRSRQPNLAAVNQQPGQQSQEMTQNFSQGGLTQAFGTGLSMSQPISQGMSQLGLSQAELSQDSYMGDEFRSQVDAALSQDSTYQGERAYAGQGLNFSQY